MKSRFENNCRTLLVTVPALCLVLTFGDSCTGDREKGLIPEKRFVTILTEIHLSDGLLMLPDIRQKYSVRDSVANYIDIIESHGYSKEAMDRTLKYYFTKKPKRLIRIYDHAIGRLTEIETVLAAEPDDIPVQKGDLWKGASTYYLYDMPELEKIYFDHIFYLRGEYNLTFSVTVYPSDQTFNPRFTACTTSADSADTGKLNYFPSIRYIKDGQPHTYTYSFRNQGMAPVILKGWLYDHENDPSGISKHAKINNISFFFTPRIL